VRSPRKPLETGKPTSFPMQTISIVIFRPNSSKQTKANDLPSTHWSGKRQISLNSLCSSLNECKQQQLLGTLRKLLSAACLLKMTSNNFITLLLLSLLCVLVSALDHEKSYLLQKDTSNVYSIAMYKDSLLLTVTNDIV
jgi:hypothetical protein